MAKVFFVLILFFCDFFSKKIIYDNIDLNSFITINKFFDIIHIHNFGISFGLFAGLVSHWVLNFIAIIILFIITYMMIISISKLEKWSFLIIISGAISNIFDRGYNGYVIDFIYLHYKDFYWPAFNFADIYISVGVMMLIIHFLKELNIRVLK